MFVFYETSDRLWALLSLLFGGYRVSFLKVNRHVCDVDRSPHVTVAVKNEWSSTFIPSIKGKGKAIPVHVRTGPEGSRRLRVPDFITRSS